MMKGIDKKFSRWAIFLSLIALLISMAVGLIWVSSVKELSVVNADTFIAALISVLGLLFTVLMGWNIYSVIDIRQYRDEMNRTMEALNKKTNETEQKFQEKTHLSDAYAYHGLAELYLGQTKYVSSYLKYVSAALYFEKAKEHNLAIHALERIYYLIRAIRCDLEVKKGTYVLDYDFHDNIAYGKDIAELIILNIKEYDILEMHKTFTHCLKIYSKHINIANTSFELYSRDADIQQRPIAIYLLMNDEECICKTMDYDKYLGILQCDLNLNHNIVAIAEFTSIEDCKQIYDKISAKEIIGSNKIGNEV